MMIQIQIKITPKRVARPDRKKYNKSVSKGIVVVEAQARLYTITKYQAITPSKSLTVRLCLGAWDASISAMIPAMLAMTIGIAYDIATVKLLTPSPDRRSGRVVHARSHDPKT